MKVLVFRLASDPIDDARGEVHQYVGDEIVITWMVAEGHIHARPLACLFAIEQALARAAPEFAREFGTVPRLRAALHAGQVITPPRPRPTSNWRHEWNRGY